jgi:UDP-N-acetylglucosamine/UDP-N-acetylgalactosamine diphosphorylase
MSQGVQALVQRGVVVPNPESVEVGPEVDPQRIEPGVVIHAGCRIFGEATAIGAGSVLGAETPMTIENCQLAENVQLAGGYAKKSVFLDGAKAGSGAQIREACLLEEGANIAHTVGLKQTILLPWATLGSLINFCDCLLAGGTGPKDHSEVGSGFIHFNFTPHGSKATASLFGDVPRGVFLREPRVFLGGQGGAVGPVHVGFGSVVAAGVILRESVDDGEFMTSGTRVQERLDRADRHRRKLREVVTRNLEYLGNLIALRSWYQDVRSAFFARSANGIAVFEGAQQLFDAALRERSSRLRAYCLGTETPDPARTAAALDQSLAAIEDLKPASDIDLCEKITGLAEDHGYVDAMHALTTGEVAQGERWLQGVVNQVVAAGSPLLSAVTR